MALTEKLSNIGDAIRAKTGKTDLLTLDEMAVEIEGISGGIEPFEINLVKYATNAFSADSWEIPFKQGLVSKITIDIEKTNAKSGYECIGAFENNEKIREFPPIELNVVCATTSNNIDARYMFASNDQVREYDVIATPESFNGYVLTPYMFQGNYRLKRLPDFVKNIALKYKYSMGTANIYYYLVYNCPSLDEIVLPVAGYALSSMFANTFRNNHHLGSVKFVTEEGGTPIDLDWKWSNQTLDLSTNVVSIGYRGFTNVEWDEERFTTDKEVTDLTSYEALKDDPDWWSTDSNFSRYNHDSAVETINSLPNVAAYDANTGNTVKFLGTMGSGYNKAINTLTEEEIAVATAKGWTITIA